MLNSTGHIIHIDFGFILTTGPGKWGMVFENAPFKMTKEYVDLMEGLHSPFFDYFKALMLQGFRAVRSWHAEIYDLIDIMRKDSCLPCFEKIDMNLLRSRFKLEVPEEGVSMILT